MVAVVSGSGLGLFGSTVGTGAAGIGQGRERIYVNSTTGNLIVQSQDEALSALGLDLSLTRTYNSQGLTDDDNGDQWRLSVQARLSAVQGTLNAAGSSVTKTFGDGRAVVYRYEVARAAYMSSDGDGAHDTLRFSGGEWLWTEGTSRIRETYDASGKLKSSMDADGNQTLYDYSGDLLTKVTDAAGQITHLDYTAGTRNLAQIRVVSQGVTQVRTRYGYDALNRLTEVTVDLSPGDGSIADGNVFFTRYTYDGDSRRIASISQADGSQVRFTYELAPDGSYRLRSYTEGNDAARTTTLSYSGGPSTGTGTGGNVLQPFIPRTNLSGRQGEWQYYTLEVPAFSSALSVVTSQGNGRPDLYVRYGAPPTLSNHDQAAAAAGDSNESIHLDNPLPGLWYVGIYADSDFSGVSLEARPQTGTQQEQVLTPGVTVGDISGSAQSVRHFRFEVPPGIGNFGLYLEGASGPADLFLTANAPVDLNNADYDTQGSSASSPQLLVQGDPRIGTWYVAVRGAQNFAHGKLVLRFNATGDPPVVTAGPAQSVNAGSTVSLTAVGNGGFITGYRWTQLDGPGGILTQPYSAQTSFITPPFVISPTVFTFRVEVTDFAGQLSTDVVRVLVNPTPTDEPPVTRIRDALGHETTYVHDAQGRIVSLTNALGERTQLVYDADGNVIRSIEDAGGAARALVFEYDTHGNVTLSRDAAGRTVRRSYNDRDQLVTETTYVGVDPDGAGFAEATQPQVKRYLYDANDRLSFTVSAEGRVSQYRYLTNGQLRTSLTYSGARYPVYTIATGATLMTSQLESWAATQDRTLLERVDYEYDFRGQLSSTTTYAGTNAFGEGVAASAARTQYVYDQRGLLLQSVRARGADFYANAADAQLPYATTYVRDGLGRVTSQTEWTA